MDFKALVIDLDGSVYYGNKLIEKADEALTLLRENYDVLFLTNNSTRSREAFVQKLAHLGIPCQKHHVVTSGYAAANYIQVHYPRSSVYVIGEQGLKQELLELGITLCEDACDSVLVGLDKDFNYTKMSKALNFILKGAVFIATNTDPFLISSEGVKPGAGAVVASLETASGKKAIVTGKPSAFIADLMIKQLQVKPQEILMVGDNLQTDILIGIKSGMKTALVLTGASKRHDIEKLHIRPDYIFKSIVHIPPFLKQRSDACIVTR